MQRAASVLLLLAAGYAGFQPKAPAPQTVYAGEASAIALPEPPPDGAELRWDPGDGTGSEAGPILRHRWQRPGRYEVRVEGPGGDARFEVEVEPRPPLRAVPSSARMALAAGWGSLAELVAMIERYTPARSEAREVVDTIEAWLGSAISDPASLEAHGLDPAEGAAIVTFAGRSEATWLLLGTLDSGRADEQARRMLQVEGAAQDVTATVEGLPAGARLFDGVARDGKAATWGHAGGYLAIRVGAPAADAAAQFERIARAEEAPLATHGPFRAARALAGGELPSEGTSAGGAVLGWVDTDEGVAPGDAVFVAELLDDALELRVGMPLGDAATRSVVESLIGGRPRPLSLSAFPAGAVGFAAFSFDPRKLYEAGLRDPAERAKAARALEEETGLTVEALLAAIGGHATAAVYLDAEALLASLLAPPGGAAQAVPPVLVSLELREGAAGAETIERVLRAGAESGATKDDDFVFRVREGLLAAATAPAARLLDAPRVDELERRIGAELLADPSQQVLFVDVAAIVDGLAAARMPPDMPAAEAAILRALLASRLEAARPLRDVVLRISLAGEGLRGGLRIGLREPGARVFPSEGGQAKTFVPRGVAR